MINIPNESGIYLSIGNPHFVIFCEDDINEINLPNGNKLDFIHMFAVMDGDITKLKQMLNDPSVRKSINSIKEL